MLHSRYILLTLLPLIVLLTAGCQTYTAKTAGRQEALEAGNILSAVDIALRQAEERHGSQDALLYRLEEGAILRAAALGSDSLYAGVPAVPVPALGPAGNLDPEEEPISQREYYLRESLRALDLADGLVEEFDQDPEVQVGKNISATLVNQAQTPYTGRGYDRIMMNTYKALNYLELGEFEAARVELNRIAQRQREAVEANARRLEEARETARKAREGELATKDGQNAPAVDVEKAKADPRTAAALDEVEARLQGRIGDYAGFDDYVNPFSVLLDGLYFLHRPEGAADLERARVSLERVVAMAPENPHAREDFVLAEQGGEPGPLVYVISESGLAPHREQTKIEFPVLILTGRLSYIGAALPDLTFNDHTAPPPLVVQVGEDVHAAAPVCRMDSVIARDFKNEWPSILTRTLIATATRATLDAVIQKQASDNFGVWGKLAVGVATMAVQAGTNIADTRSWRSLPKEFHYIRMPMPEDRVLHLRSGPTTLVLELDPGEVVVVYVRAFTATSPLLVSQFTLK